MDTTQDATTPPAPVKEVESTARFFLKDDQGNWLAPKVSNETREERWSCVDEISAEMKKAEEEDSGYMDRLRRLHKDPLNEGVSAGLRNCGQVVLLPEAGSFVTRVRTGPSEIGRLKYGTVIKLTDPYKDDMFTFATPNVPENFHKFILIRCPFAAFPSYPGGDPDPYRWATDLFRVDFFDYPEDMENKPTKDPPPGSLVYTNDQVQLVALRQDGDKVTVRGYANPFYKKSIGDTEWKPSEGKVYTFHYGTARKEWKGPPPDQEFENVEDEVLYPR